MATKSLKTYELKELKLEKGMPTGVWDPSWEKPEVGIKVAAQAYKQMRLEAVEFGNDGLIANDQLKTYPVKRTESRSFALDQVQSFEKSKTKLRCGSYGEIFKRYTFGAGSGKAPVNFHVQALTFGADSDGRWFVRGSVGRVDGGWGVKAGLVVRFVGKDGKSLGGVQWEGELDPPKDVPVRFLGCDKKLADKFDSLKEVQVTFYSDPG
jgi:hypothetical protein